LLAFAVAGCASEADDSWQGYIEGEFVLLASPYAGQLQKLYVRRGERVDSGKPVFALEQEAEAPGAGGARAPETAQARLEPEGAERLPRSKPCARSSTRPARARAGGAAARRARSFTRAASIAQTRATQRATYEREVARVREAEAQLKNALQLLGRDAERSGGRRGRGGEGGAAQAADGASTRRASRRRWRAWCTNLLRRGGMGSCRPAGRGACCRATSRPASTCRRLLSAVSVGRDIEIRCDGCPGPVAPR
jgi:HlyD family secretion protein